MPYSAAADICRLYDVVTLFGDNDQLSPLPHPNPELPFLTIQRSLGYSSTVTAHYF